MRPSSSVQRQLALSAAGDQVPGKSVTTMLWELLHALNWTMIWLSAPRQRTRSYHECVYGVLWCSSVGPHLQCHVTTPCDI